MEGPGWLPGLVRVFQRLGLYEANPRLLAHLGRVDCEIRIPLGQLIEAGFVAIHKLELGLVLVSVTSWL